MGMLQNRVIEYLRVHEWKFDLSEEAGFIRYTISGNNGSWTTLLDVDEDDNLMIITARIPVVVPEPARTRVAEYCVRANCRLSYGSFSMEFDDGEVFLRTTVFSPEDKDGIEALEFAMNINASVFDDHLPAIMSVAFSSVNPADALEEVLGGKKPDKSYLYN